MARTITRYVDFWPYYLREHAKPETRRLHYIGTALTFVFLAFALVMAAGGGCWFRWPAMASPGRAHFGVEKNRPATFTYPLWSLFSDYRMFFLWLSGRLGPHLERAGSAPRGRSAKYHWPATADLRRLYAMVVCRAGCHPRLSALRLLLRKSHAERFPSVEPRVIASNPEKRRAWRERSSAMRATHSLGRRGAHGLPL